MKRVYVLLLLSLSAWASACDDAERAFERGDAFAAKRLFADPACNDGLRKHFFLGYLYFSGLGGEKNLKRAGDLFKKGVLSIAPRTKKREFDGYSAEYDRALYWFTKLAEAGYPEAQLRLALLYGAGEIGPIDHEKAAYWFKKAAQSGESLAQLNLGVYYVAGFGVKRDLSEGVRWLRRAAENGSVEAQNYLGALYANQKEPGPDYAEAFGYYKMAAERNHPIAQYNLALMYCQGKGVEKDLERCSFWARKAYANGIKEPVVKLRERFGLKP